MLKTDSVSNSMLLENYPRKSRDTISIMALLLTLLFIFSIPWGNAVWDGLTKYFGFIAIAFVGLSFTIAGTQAKFSVFHLLIAFFASWLTITYMWSPDIARGQFLLLSTLQLLMVAFVLTMIINSRNDLLLFYKSYLFGNLVGSGIIIYNYLNGIESTYYQRYAIPTLDIDGQSVMLTLAIPMAAYLSTQSTQKWIKILYALSIPTIVFAVFLTGTRTASIIAIIGVLYWLFTFRKASFRIKSTFIILFITSLIAVFTFAPKESVDRIISTGESISSGTLNNRTVIWRGSIEQWKKSPIVGHGIGSLGYTLSTQHVEYDSAHNTFIHIMTENGLIGLAIYLLIIISIIYYSMQTSLSEKAFLMSLLLMILVSQTTQHTHFHKETWFALTMLAIHAYSFGRDEQHSAQS